MFLCPFCMKYHHYSKIQCPEKKIRIPSVYLEDSKRGVPIVVMLTIGYSGHGKTCFLSSFFHTLYRGKISEKWPGFSFIGLTMETLNRIHSEYVNILDHGRLPPKTPIMFPTPLILKFQQIPLKVKSFFKKYFQGVTMEQGELICGIAVNIGYVFQVFLNHFFIPSEPIQNKNFKGQHPLMELLIINIFRQY